MAGNVPQPRRNPVTASAQVYRSARHMMMLPTRETYEIWLRTRDEVEPLLPS